MLSKCWSRSSRPWRAFLSESKRLMVKSQVGWVNLCEFMCLLLFHKRSQVEAVCAESCYTALEAPSTWSTVVQVFVHTPCGWNLTRVQIWTIDLVSFIRPTIRPPTDCTASHLCHQRKPLIVFSIHQAGKSKSARRRDGTLLVVYYSFSTQNDLRTSCNPPVIPNRWFHRRLSLSWLPSPALLNGLCVWVVNWNLRAIARPNTFDYQAWGSQRHPYDQNCFFL